MRITRKSDYRSVINIGAIWPYARITCVCVTCVYVYVYTCTVLVLRAKLVERVPLIRRGMIENGARATQLIALRATSNELSIMRLAFSHIPLNLIWSGYSLLGIFSMVFFNRKICFFNFLNCIDFSSLLLRKSLDKMWLD